MVALCPSGSGAMEGGEVLALQLSPAQMSGHQPASLDPAPVQMLERAGSRELQRLRSKLVPLPAGLEIPRGDLGQQVALALRLIGSGACPPVLQLAQGA